MYSKPQFSSKELRQPMLKVERVKVLQPAVDAVVRLDQHLRVALL